jgi:hypothetical protein
MYTLTIFVKYDFTHSILISLINFITPLTYDVPPNSVNITVSGYY